MRKAVCVLLLLACLASLFGCFPDMGYEDEEEYYTRFGDTVKMRYTDGEFKTLHSDSESIRSAFYNEESVNELDFDDLIDAEYYCLFAIQQEAGETVEVRDLALFIKGVDPEARALEVRMFVADRIPSSIRTPAAPTQRVVDEETGETEPILYEDRAGALGEPLAVATCLVRENEWTSILLDSFTVNGQKTKRLTVEDGQYVLLQFYSNTGYAKDEGKQPVRFTATNLLVSCPGKKK